MESSTRELLDMEQLSMLPTLELKARFLVDGFMVGEHRSPRRGSSVEFKEYREYQTGDDPAMIDWKAYARSDRLQMRLREDDANLRAYLLLDRSASMDYSGAPERMTKWDYARSLAAALLLFLNRQRDIGYLGFCGDGLEGMNGSGSSSLHSMTSRLNCAANVRNSPLVPVLHKFAGMVKRRSIVIVISDFYVEPDKLRPVLRKLTYEKCETLLFQVLDPTEIDLAFPGSGLFTELESGDQLPVCPELIRHKYNAVVSEHVRKVQETARTYSGDSLLLRTDVAPLAALGLYLSKRKGR